MVVSQGWGKLLLRRCGVRMSCDAARLSKREDEFRAKLAALLVEDVGLLSNRRVQDTAPKALEACVVDP
jgi:hypothetical protein